MQTFRLVLDNASLLWVVVCLYSILSCHQCHLPAWEDPPTQCLVSLKHIHRSFPVCFYPFTVSVVALCGRVFSSPHHPPAL
ncbi:hypothetical protein B0H14DRAFT_2938261, partial [Mycena olivaceomarginata]